MIDALKQSLSGSGGAGTSSDPSDSGGAPTTGKSVIA